MKKIKIIAAAAFIACLVFAVTAGTAANAVEETEIIPPNANPQFKTHLTDNDYTVISPQKMKERFIEKTKILFEEPYYSKITDTVNGKIFMVRNAIYDWKTWAKFHGMPSAAGQEEVLENSANAPVEERFNWIKLYDKPYRVMFNKMESERSKKWFVEQMCSEVLSQFGEYQGSGWEPSKQVITDPKMQDVYDAFEEMAEWHRNNWDKYRRFVNVFDDTPVYGQANDDGSSSVTSETETEATTELTTVTSAAKITSPAETSAVNNGEPKKENLFLKNKIDIIAIAVVGVAFIILLLVKKFKKNKKDW